MKNKTFTLTLDILLIFTVTTPLLGLASHKAVIMKATGVYATIGLAISGLSLYGLYNQVRLNDVILVCNYLPWIGACLEVDMLGIVMALSYIIIGISVLVYSIKYMEHISGYAEYNALFLAMVAGLMGVVFAGDFFTMFVFWELMSLTSYILVAYHRRSDSLEASFKYLIMSSMGNVAIVFAMAFLYGLTGTLNFAQLFISLSGVKPFNWLFMTFLLIIIGFGIKAAIVPFHTWLPDAYDSAPSPVTAALAAITTTTGIYALSRVIFMAFTPIQFYWGVVIAIMSVSTMTLANVLALIQNDIKRLLAYSGLSQIGYIIVGVAAGTQLGMTGVIFHLFNNAIIEAVVFLCVGAFVYTVGTLSLDELSGIGFKMPITAFTLCIGLLALVGIPPLNGFIGKLILFLSAVEANMLWLAIAGVLNSVFSLAYYMRIIRVILRTRPSERVAISRAKETPALMLIPILILTVLIFIIGIWPSSILHLANQAAAGLVNPDAYISTIVGGK